MEKIKQVFEKEDKGINLPYEELCTNVSEKTGVVVDEIKTILSAFSEIFLSKFKLK